MLEMIQTDQFKSFARTGFIFAASLSVTFAGLTLFQMLTNYKTTNVQYQAQLQDAEKSISKMREDISLLQDYKQRFLTSMQSIEGWMDEIQPLIDQDGLSAAHQAQANMISYLNREMKNIEERFNELPTIRDVEEVKQKLVAFLDSHQPKKPVMTAASRHGKVLERTHMI